MKKHIPNLLSLTNATFGAFGAIYALVGNFNGALICILICLVADFFDGFMARLLQSFSPLGKDLDSLADSISFGLLPAFMVFNLITIAGSSLYFMALLIVPASIYRLAKFNNDSRQTTSFIGLPTPANAIFWISYVQVMKAYIHVIPTWLFTLITLLLVIITSFLLISEIPMFSLKLKSYKWQDNQLLYTYLTGTLFAIIFFGFAGLLAAMTAYILINVIKAFQR